MPYCTFQGIQLSRLGMGNMRLPVTGENGDTIDVAKARTIIDQAIAGDINYFDTAYIYHNGQSESFLDQALLSYPRDQYYLADKFNLQADQNYRRQFKTQLERLKTDYIDFYLLHGVSDDSAQTFLDNGCIDYFRSLKKEGRIRYLGFSFHGKPETLEKMVTRAEWDFVQIQLNYYDWYYGTAKRQYEILCEHHLPIMVMEPVHGGMLANIPEEARACLQTVAPSLQPAEWAFRFVADLPQVNVVLSGMSTTEQLSQNLCTFETLPPLSTAEKEAIQQACTIIHQSVGVPCTACRYCLNHCPQHLNIPELLQFYNEYHTGGKWRLGRLKAEDPAKLPGNCIACGLCTKHCPQDIKVYQYLHEMDEDYHSLNP